MGSSVQNTIKDVTGDSIYNSTSKAWRDYGVYVGNGGTTALTNAYEGYRRDGGSGIQGGVAQTASQAIDTPRQLVNPDDPDAPVEAMADASLASETDPEKRRRRLLEGRAGTILTAGGTAPGGSNLGGSGARSTLLGL